MGGRLHGELGKVDERDLANPETDGSILLYFLRRPGEPAQLPRKRRVQVEGHRAYGPQAHSVGGSGARSEGRLEYALHLRVPEGPGSGQEGEGLSAGAKGWPATEGKIWISLLHRVLNTVTSA